MLCRLRAACSGRCLKKHSQCPDRMVPVQFNASVLPVTSRKVCLSSSTLRKLRAITGAQSKLTYAQGETAAADRSCWAPSWRHIRQDRILTNSPFRFSGWHDIGSSWRLQTPAQSFNDKTPRRATRRTMRLGSKTGTNRRSTGNQVKSTTVPSSTSISWVGKMPSHISNNASAASVTLSAKEGDATRGMIASLVASEPDAYITVIIRR